MTTLLWRIWHRMVCWNKPRFYSTPTPYSRGTYWCRECGRSHTIFT